MLPDDLRARIQERVFIESVEPVGRSFYPDVHVYERRGAGALRATPGEGARAGDGPVAIAEPLVIHVPGTEITEGYVEIVDARSGGRVVTVIEFVAAPTRPLGRDATCTERSRTTRRGRARISSRSTCCAPGSRSRSSPRTSSPRQAAHPTTYPSGEERGRTRSRYYPIPLRERVPTIKVPLRPTDADVALDLQALVDLSYERGRYDDIDYGELLDPPLSVDDVAWTRSVLESAETRHADG